ncbi:MAG TPA: YqgE/AlgH family protein [Acidimicrobiales bacterium]|nr:YqgE/AlgH family protein [Acidimicrobiales bacterium]
MPAPDPLLPAPAPGALLVAGPSLEDPNFHRTVVLLLAFSASDGALGVVLNRPNRVPVAELLAGWSGLAAPPDSVFVGGPVSRESVICLARLRPSWAGGPVTEESDGCSPVPGVPGLATLDLNRRPDEVQDGVEAVRLFSGYAGWSAGQLEAEVDAGGWLILPGSLSDAFDTDPDGLWPRVLRRSGGRIALYANAPPKLSMN